MTEPIWKPDAGRVARANLTAFIDQLRSAQLAVGSPEARTLVDVPALYQWSVDHPAAFWPAVWEFCGVVAEGVVPPEAKDAEVVHGLEHMAPPNAERGAHWFRGARLNFAENLLRYVGDGPAVIAWNENGRQRTISHNELRQEVARCASALRESGVAVGDRVAGYLPNLPETVVAMLATASLGAIWSSCSPDFGVQGVLDRFGQIEPKVLLVSDGYHYGGKVIDCRDRVPTITAGLPTVTRVVMIQYVGLDVSSRVADVTTWADWLESAPAEDPPFVRLPFDHPLYIMYSSGTTGLPKCMVHGAGGTLLQHLKELVLHTDLGPEDVIFYYTTCGWMMWNWLVSALAVGATLVLYDGSPMVRKGALLWEMAAAARVTVFGTSAKFLSLSQKARISPARSHDLSALRTILSTGSPLAPQSYDYVYGDVKSDVCLSSISGGTDIISCFALGNPVGAVYRGELQMRGLGMAVAVLDGAGKAVVGEAGELVCVRPFPSMPVAFWNDSDGARYRAAYFEGAPGVWQHGDWATLTERGGLVIHGRSDATLNPGGVRIGTADIYRQVEELPEIVESLVVGQDMDAGEDVRIVLFVRLAPGVRLDDVLRDRIRRRVREGASPHHVPRVIVAVDDLPRTVSGKISELAVRNVIHGRPVLNAEALANPDSLRLFAGLPELQRAEAPEVKRPE